MDKFEIERLHDEGLMPDWAYYQQVNKPWYVAMREQETKFQEEIKFRQEKKEQAVIDQKQQEQIEKQVEDIIEKAIDNLFKGFE